MNTRAPGVPAGAPRGVRLLAAGRLTITSRPISMRLVRTSPAISPARLPSAKTPKNTAAAIRPPVVSWLPSETARTRMKSSVRQPKITTAPVLRP